MTSKHAFNSACTAITIVVAVGGVSAFAGACPKAAPLEPVHIDAGANSGGDADGGPSMVITEDNRKKLASTLDKALSAKDCPDGAKRVGAEPPEGKESWCEREVEGKSVKDGPYEAWHDDGVKAITGSYKDGEREGTWVQWHANGQRKQEVTYVKGKPEGRFREWDEHGSTIADAIYKNGKVVK